MLRERCACGAEFEANSGKEYEWLKEWRANHECLTVEPEPQGAGPAQVELAPDYTIPEMHIGFRY